MAVVHSQYTVVTLDGDSMTGYSSSVTFTRTVEAHDVTVFGKSSKVYAAGLKDSTGSLEGFYDSTAVTGPRAVILGVIAAGLPVKLVYRPEGTGSGKPESEVDVIVTSYEETSPVDDMITFSVELQGSDAIDDTAQS
jgi:hypothetical protein